MCFEGQNRNLKKKSCRFKTWMEFVSQILMKLKTSSSEGLLMKVFSHSLMWLSKHCSGHYVTTQACTLISWGCVHLRWCGALDDYTLWKFGLKMGKCFIITPKECCSWKSYIKSWRTRQNCYYFMKSIQVVWFLWNHLLETPFRHVFLTHWPLGDLGNILDK